MSTDTAPSLNTTRHVEVEGIDLEVVRTYDPLTQLVTHQCWVRGTDAPALDVKVDSAHPAFQPNCDEEHLVTELTEAVQTVGWDWANARVSLDEWTQQFSEEVSA